MDTVSPVVGRLVSGLFPSPPASASAPPLSRSRRERHPRGGYFFSFPKGRQKT